MDLTQLKTIADTCVADTYARQDLLASAGKGATLNNDEGRPFIDFSSGIGVNSLGFANPAWVTAVKSQIDTLQHISNLYYTEPMALLAQELCARTGMKRAFFSNSGAEANEGAIKTARKYSADKYSAARCEIVTLQNSFHGRTIATLAATGQDIFHQHFGPFPPGFVHAAINDLEDLNRKVTANTCAIMIECIQGEGGVCNITASFASAIATLCAERDILLVVDEIQTGMGRTGKLLCGEHFGLQPDVVTLAKGLGGGLPIGAVLFGEKTEHTLGKGDHGSTFGANPVCCAGARAVLQTLDDDFLAAVTAKGEYLREKLAALPHVVSLSGLGLMIGIELADGIAAADVIARARDKGLILLSAKSKLRLLPPLTITREEMDLGLDILAEALQGQ